MNGAGDAAFTGQRQHPSPAGRPPRQDWRSLYAFGLPNGSVRAVLALMVCGTIWALLWLRPDRPVPDSLQNLMFIILGHYFATRGGQSPGAAQDAAEAGPPPLYLPRGTVRWMLVLGFVAVAWLLVRHGGMAVTDAAGVRPSHAAVTLILVGGFLLGVVVARVRARLARRGRRPPRLFEDVRAAVALLAGVLLVLTLFGLLSLPDAGTPASVQRWMVKYRIEDVLAAVIGFYFGSRS